MNAPDFVNGAFEVCGGIVNFFNVAALYRDKAVKGVRIFPAIVFSAWGLWNLYYYPHLNQWFSFIGGVSIVSANIAWAVLAIHYKKG
jgi:hypothetical protein